MEKGVREVMSKFSDLIKRKDVSESEIKLYKTNNYNLFCSLSGNRKVTKKHVEKITDSILTGGDIKSPVVVNEKLEVIDGQNTFEARKELGLPIYFYCCSGATIESCRAMNSSSVRWTMTDYIHSYSIDNEEYEKLINFCNENNTTIYALYAILHGSMPGNATTLKNGTFSATDEEYETARLVLKYIPEIYETLGFVGKVNNTFRRAVYLMVTNPQYDHKRMIRQCKKYKAPVKMMRKVKDMLIFFTDVYKTSKSIVHFEDTPTVMNVANRDYFSSGSSKEEPSDVSSLKRR